MRASMRLLILVAAATLATCCLGALCLASVTGLSTQPTGAWGTAQLSRCLVALCSLAGALGAAWHVLSGVVALAALGAPTVRGTGHGRFSQISARALERWGAPLVRRALTGSVLTGLLLPAGAAAAAAATPAPDDLGWTATSATATEPALPGPIAAVMDSPSAALAAPTTDLSPVTSPSASEPTAPAEATSPTASTTTPSASPASAADPSASPAKGAESSASPDASPTASAPSETDPPSDPDSAAAPGTPAPGAADAEADAAGTHVVLTGESLWSITAEALGDGATDADVAAAWPELYTLNAERVGADPSLVVTGTTLVLPTDLGARASD